MSERPRRGFLSGLAGACLALLGTEAKSATVLAVRIWPAEDYTRVALELDQPLKPRHFVATDPPRVVVDLEGIDLDAPLRELVSKVQPTDPYIAAVRVGQFKPRVVRLVFDLKSEVTPQFVALKPVAAYRYRLLLDFQPVRTAPTRTPNAATVPASTRPATSPATTSAPATPARDKRDKAAGPRTPAHKMVIAIDAGHGGEDPGAIGALGTHEKDVTLGIARLLRDRIDADPTMRAVMVRDADYFVPLARRVDKARAADADLLISLHADAFVEPQTQGASVFVHSGRGATTYGAKWLAKRENASDQVGGVSAGPSSGSRMLLTLSAAEQARESRRLGRAVLQSLQGVGRLHRPRVEKASFVVLGAPDLPSILIETGFISNPDEERRLRSRSHQRALADAIYSGIRRYLKQTPPRRA